MSDIELRKQFAEDVINAILTSECAYSLSQLGSLYGNNKEIYDQERYNLVNSVALILHTHILRFLYNHKLESPQGTQLNKNEANKHKQNYTKADEYIEATFNHLNEIIYGSFQWALNAKSQSVEDMVAQEDSVSQIHRKHKINLAIVANTLARFGSILPNHIHEQLMFDLDALQYGDAPTELLRPTESGKHHPAKILERLRFKAHEHIVFRKGLGLVVTGTIQDVAKAYGLTASALQRHKTRLKGENRRLLLQREDSAHKRGYNLKDYLHVRNIIISPEDILKNPEIVIQKISDYIRKNRHSESKTQVIPYTIKETLDLYSEVALDGDGSRYMALSHSRKVAE